MVAPPRLASPRTLLPRLALLLLPAACTRAPRPDDRPVRVLVYNVHAGKDAKNVDNLAGVAALVRETGADLILLQEIDRRTRRSGNVDQVGVLAERTGMRVAFGKSLDFEGGEYGVALLSRWPILHDTLVRLPVSPPQQRAGGVTDPRGALRAVVETPRGRITVINTHLDPTGNDRWRVQEIAQVVALARQALVGGAEAVLVGGDFNAEPASRSIQMVREGGLRDGWTECHGATLPGLTFPADSAVKRIDYLFLAGAARCRSARVIATQVSDHRPVLVEVALDPAR